MTMMFNTIYYMYTIFHIAFDINGVKLWDVTFKSWREEK